LTKRPRSTKKTSKGSGGKGGVLGEKSFKQQGGRVKKNQLVHRKKGGAQPTPTFTQGRCPRNLGRGEGARFLKIIAKGGNSQPKRKKTLHHGFPKTGAGKRKTTHKKGNLLGGKKGVQG